MDKISDSPRTILRQSNQKLKQFMNGTANKNGDFLNKKTVSSLLEDIPSTLENKFDTPGPGSYDIVGTLLTSRQLPV